MFIQSRKISLALATLHDYNPPQDQESSGIDVYALDILLQSEIYKESNNIILDRFQLASKMGSSNLNNVEIGDPDRDSVEKMLYEICGERCHGPIMPLADHILSGLEYEDFMVYMSLITWITVVLSGKELCEFKCYVLLRQVQY